MTRCHPGDLCRDEFHSQDSCYVASAFLLATNLRNQPGDWETSLKKKKKPKSMHPHLTATLGMYYFLADRTNLILSASQFRRACLWPFYWKGSQGVTCPGALASISHILVPLLCPPAAQVTQSLWQCQGQWLYWAHGQWLSHTCCWPRVSHKRLVTRGQPVAASTLPVYPLLATESSQCARRILLYWINGTSGTTELSFCFSHGYWHQSSFLDIMFNFVFQ